MQPIVRGLEGEFVNRVQFLYLNAADGAQGQRAFEQFALPGHPGFLLVDADQRERFRALGLVDAQTLRDALQASLESAS